MQDNEKYLTELNKKNTRIKALELTIDELNSQIASLKMQLANTDLINRMAEKDKPRLSTVYKNALSQHDFNDPFNNKQNVGYKATEKSLSPDKPAILGEGGSDENSLAKQLGIDESGQARNSTLNKVFNANDLISGPTEQKKEEPQIMSLADLGVGQQDNKFGLAQDADKNKPNPIASGVDTKVKVRESNIFQSKAYFKNKLQNLDIINEDEEGNKLASIAEAEAKRCDSVNEMPDKKQEMTAEQAQNLINQLGAEDKKEAMKPETVEEIKKKEEQKKTEELAKTEEIKKAEELKKAEEQKKVENEQKKISEVKKEEVDGTPHSVQPNNTEEEKKVPEGVPVGKKMLKKAGPGEQSLEMKKSGEEIAAGTGAVNGEIKPVENGPKDAAKLLQEKFANKIKEQNKKVAAVLGSSGIDIRASKITTFDFLTLKKNDKISKMLSNQKETGSAIIFSDYIFMLREDNLAHKSKRILYVTEYSLYILHHTTYQIQRITPITDLKMIIIVKTSGTLIAFHFEKAYFLCDQI